MNKGQSVKFVFSSAGNRSVFMVLMLTEEMSNINLGIGQINKSQLLTFISTLNDLIKKI